MANSPAPDNLIPPNCNEIRHLFTTLVTQSFRAAALWLHCMNAWQTHDHPPEKTVLKATPTGSPKCIKGA